MRPLSTQMHTSMNLNKWPTTPVSHSKQPIPIMSMVITMASMELKDMEQKVMERKGMAKKATAKC
jgi:hypothetical protein